MDTGNPGAAQKMFACSVGGVDGLWTQDVGATSVDECSKCLITLIAVLATLLPVGQCAFMLSCVSILP